MASTVFIWDERLSRMKDCADSNWDLRLGKREWNTASTIFPGKTLSRVKIVLRVGLTVSFVVFRHLYCV